MDILVKHIYDELRFKHYFRIKLMLPDKSKLIDDMINNVNSGKKVEIYNLPECDVRYLQRCNLEHGEYFCAISKPICSLKILNDKFFSDFVNYFNVTKNKSSIYVNMPSRPDDEPKQDTLFHVKFTKIIHYDEMLNEQQIQSLLKDNHVKSINIEK